MVFEMHQSHYSPPSRFFFIFQIKEGQDRKKTPYKYNMKNINKSIWKQFFNHKVIDEIIQKFETEVSEIFIACEKIQDWIELKVNASSNKFNIKFNFRKILTTRSYVAKHKKEIQQFISNIIKIDDLIINQ